ncbi:uncharacterized mitochondrial protein AtMg00860-like [Arachis duranensis]|uniref:Uncharacterized mitochondrial protein AtMg00860-like n=1 Tax=Arachis duranensis TaxID=130453 RepID=A0A6P5NKL2_ARADU|nr:uncharacterized mitochondrial protein AtMg00860-like [Arachis duranensis]
MLQILKERKLYAKLSECDFLKEEVKFLGHVVSKNEIDVVLAKVEAVKEWEQPTSVIEVQSFLELVGYYRKFINDFSHITLTMTRLTRKDAPFVWMLECEESFKTLKDMITTALVLVLPESYEPFMPSETLQPLEIPQLKWEGIAIDFMSNLPRTKVDFDVVWVIADRLTKSAHFLRIHMTYTLEELAMLYIKKIVRLYSVPMTMVSNRDPRFTSEFWRAF